MDTNPTPHEWRLSEILYKTLHQWPIILVFCLVGALIGWGISYLSPVEYRTRADISVSLNPYRAYSDSQFLALVYPQYSNIDDYKNWQMSQLSSAIFSDPIIKPTLEDLRDEDEYWNGLNPEDLRAMLRAEWRTAGTWTLLSDDRSAKRSNQSVRAWSRNVVSGIKRANLAADQVVQIDESLRGIINEQNRLALQREDYKIAKTALDEWLTNSSSIAQDQPLQPMERWRILYLAGRVAQFSPAWQGIYQQQPAPDALPPEYSDWVNRIGAALETEIPSLAQRWDFLEQQRQLLSKEYDKKLEESLGLSPNLVIKGLDKSLPESLRSTALMTLVGTIVGLLVWVIWLLASLTRQRLNT